MNDKPKEECTNCGSTNILSGGVIHLNGDGKCRLCGRQVVDSTPAQDGDKREWEEEFEKLWTIGSIGTEIKFGHFSSAKGIQKEFIRHILSRAIERTLAEAREVVLGMKKMSGTDIQDTSPMGLRYNMACDDIARALTKNK